MMKWFILSRTIHRLLVIVVSFLTIIMSVGGFFMKYPNLKPAFADLGLIRSLHNGLSIWFSVALLAMAITGLSMYIIPHLRTKKQNEQN